MEVILLPRVRLVQSAGLNKVLILVFMEVILLHKELINIKVSDVAF